MHQGETVFVGIPRSEGKEVFAACPRSAMEGKIETVALHEERKVPAVGSSRSVSYARGREGASKTRGVETTYVGE